MNETSWGALGTAVDVLVTIILGGQIVCMKSRAAHCVGCIARLELLLLSCCTAIFCILVLPLYKPFFASADSPA